MKCSIVDESHFAPGLVSVIIPARNRASLIIESLNSVYHQVYRPIEAMVIDDGSTDRTESAVAEWAIQAAADRWFGVRYIRQEPAGAPAARNHGLDLSRGEFIQFLDSDDLLHYRKLRDQIEALRRNPQVDYAYSEAATFSSAVDWEATAEYGKPDSANLAAQIRSPALNTICGIYRRRVCLEVGPWNERLDKWQDWEYNVRVLARGTRCVSTPGLRALIRRHEGGQIADLSHSERGLRAMAYAVSQVETVLGDSPLYDRAVAESLAIRWSLVAAEAIRGGRPDLAASAARSGRRHARSTSRKLRLRLLRMLASLPPTLASRACRELLAIAHARSRKGHERRWRQSIGRAARHPDRGEAAIL